MKNKHEKYDILALQVVKGKLGYIPAKKSQYSKTYTGKFHRYQDF